MRLTLFIVFTMLLFSTCKNSIFRSGGRGNSPQSNVSKPERAESTKKTGQTDSDSATDAGSAPKAQGTLVWKRYRAIENSLMNALSLTKPQVCQELGQFNCVDRIHLTSLGGNFPLLGQYERPGKPSVLTPLVMERIVLSACTTRLELDRAAGAQAQVFKQFSLNASSVSATEVEQLTVELFQRILARDPSTEEKAAISGMASQLGDGATVAKSVCFAIGTLPEFILI